MPTLNHFHPSLDPTRHRIGMVSTYPPKLCGLATFASALERELVRAGNRVDVVALDDGDGEGIPAANDLSWPVTARLVNGVTSSVRNALDALSQCDVVILQHEYGIYGGPDGDEVLDLLDGIDAPTIVVLHTVLLQPTQHQREVLEAVCARADQVVVMTQTAAERLAARYAIDASKLATISHGAATPQPEDVAHDRRGSQRPQLLTWGLLGPGKGIEHVIDALAMLKDVRPRISYTVAGVTHPKVFARRGDEYRQALLRRSWAAGVAASVDFDDTYRNVTQLTRFVASADLVVLPYDSRDQVTSGVLVDAIAAGRPVIATAFPHAVELLASGAGIVVPHADPAALAQAIRAVTCDADLMASMVAEARRLAPTLSWATVAGEYLALCDDLIHVAAPVAR